MRSGIDAVPHAVRAGRPTVWISEARRPCASVLPELPLQWSDVEVARERWRRFEPLLARLFPSLAPIGGHIDSPLLRLSQALTGPASMSRQPAWLKADHDLPVTGCIKARGGVHEVLWHAERVALAAGGLSDYASLADPVWRERFSQHTVVVGSTGNLGYSVGVIARALGFAAEVHLSSDAQAWKKDRLRRLGVSVVEHAADYSVAVAAARHAAAVRPSCHFVDDEASVQLFVGYATGAFDLQRQLGEAGVAVNEAHPLTVYLPCGVGGAPGGLTFGLKHLFGDAVRCVFVEPVESPCMLVRLASGEARPVSVHEIGRSNRTVQDGLAVATASSFAAGMVGHLIEGIVTVSDAQSLAWLKRAWLEGGLRLEPSAASALAAMMAWQSQVASDPTGTHVAWATGGGLLPDEVFFPLMETAGATGTADSPYSSL